MSTNKKSISIYVEYEDSEIAKSLETIIKSPYKKDFVKLLTPMLCTNDTALKVFTKIFTGNGLKDPIPNNTTAYIKLDNFGWGVDLDEIRNRNLVREDDTILVTITKFCGYHTPFQYEITYPCVKDGKNSTKTTTVKEQDLIIFKEF